jgi:hypothetical protein
LLSRVASHARKISFSLSFGAVQGTKILFSGIPCPWFYQQKCSSISYRWALVEGSYWACSKAFLSDGENHIPEGYRNINLPVLFTIDSYLSPAHDCTGHCDDGGLDKPTLILGVFKSLLDEVTSSDYELSWLLVSGLGCKVSKLNSFRPHHLSSCGGAASNARYTNRLENIPRMLFQMEMVTQVE